MAVIGMMGGGAVVIPRAEQGTPLLVGPPGASTSIAPDDEGPSTVDDSPFTTSTAISSTQHATTTTTNSSDRASTTSTDSSASITSIASITTPDSSSASPTPTTAAIADPPRQPSSIRYLVPVFLIVLITLGGWIFRKYRKRKTFRERESTRQTKSRWNENEWKELKHDNDDYDDPWDAGDDDLSRDHDMNWRGKDIRPSPSAEVTMLSVAGRGWAWRDTFKDWQSARGRESQLNGGGETGLGEMGERTTMKLVTRNMEPSYQTLLSPAGPFADGADDKEEDQRQDEDRERGSIRALRDKIASLSYAPSPRQGAGLECNRAPNKRLSQRDMALDMDVVPLDPPAWIRPRAVSPTTQILSPPLQPHLFFHPTTSVQSIHELIGQGQGQGHQHVMTEITEDPSGSEYGSDDGTATVISKGSHIIPTMPDQGGGTIKFPRIPSTASGLAGGDSYSAVASAKVEPKSNLGRKSSTSQRQPTISTSSSSSKSKPTASRASRVPPSSLSKVKASSPLALRRSTAVQNLTKPSPGTTLSPDTSPGLLSPNAAKQAAGSPRKTRTQRKEQKARDKVEDILKASWSGRALTSPPLNGSGSVVEHLGGSNLVPGMMSPGLEETGGIEQRLAMLRRVEL
ncbi:hypothetical protein IAR55_005745 [Kwoniella newhampshirensis]|uniref:Uncharacterized protein n=1 Tax=Kwoniella newhampshirensis TaxID=1651941 RepID=A0AAW0YVH3_9TREE